jgi:hypothetical protein
MKSCSWILGALIASLGFFVSADDLKSAASPAKPSLTVSTISPTPTLLREKITANGNLAAWQEAIIGAEANGLKITEVRINVGDRVQRGDVLAVLQADTLRAELAQAEAALAQAQAPFAAQVAQAEASRAAAEAQKALSEAQGGAKTQAQQGEERDRVSRLNQLVQQINRVEQLYRAGPGQTEGFASIQDYFPTDANSRLDVAGAQLSQQGLAAFRVPGTGTVSDRDATMFDRGNLPTAATRDVANEEIIRGLKARVEEELSALGQPAPQWGSAPAQRDDQTGLNAMDVIRTNGGQGGGGGAVPRADATGPNFRMADNPALARAHDDLVQTLISQGGGRLDPQAYAQGRAALIREFGVDVAIPAADMQAGAQWANEINQYLDGGGRTIPTELGVRELMSARETMANNLVNNPVGAALVGAANTGSFGAVEAIAPGQYMALGDAQPVSQTIGEVGGAIAGTGAIGGIGRAIAGRAAPQLLQGGARGQFARNVGTDAAYGAGFGGVTEGDPLTGALIGTAGSVAGQGVARGLGAAVGGVQRTAAAEALRNRGVPVSVARQIGLGRVEDLAQSIPVVGGVSRARQLDSFTGFNEAAMREAGQPIGFNPTQVGAAGVEDFGNAVSTAYDDATRGAVAPVDTQTFRDLRPVTQAIRGLPDDYRSAAETIMDLRITPTLASGNITGEQFQQAIRGIKQARSNAGRNPSLAGFEQEFRDALTGVEDMLTGTMTRGAGPDVAANLNAANAANRGFKTIENASLDRAKVGTQAGEVNVFTPAQLIQSARQSENRGFGQNPLMELGRQGQDVLPSTVPNSGTTDRMLAVQALGGVGALGGAAGLVNDPSAQGAAQGSGAAIGTTASLAALAALLGTRGGQRALEGVLISRPQIAQQAGQGIRRRSGLFGSTGAGLALGY